MTETTAIISPVGISHVRLTVSDIHRSKAFYQRLLGTEFAFDFTDRADDPEVRNDPAQLFGGFGFSLGDQLLGLRPAPDAGSAGRFDSSVAGLDHVSLMLGSTDDLRAAIEALDAAGVEHGEYTELTDFGMAIVSVQDPDDINLELSARLS